VNADLMRPASQRDRFDKGPAGGKAEELEPGFGVVSAGTRWAAEVSLTGANKGGAKGLRSGGWRLIGQEEVAFVDRTIGELPGEGTIGAAGFGEEQDAGGVFVEAVKESEAGPTRFALAEPVVEAFIVIGSWCVGIESGWFIHHEQIIIFEQETGRRRQGHQKNHAPFATTQTPSRRLVMA
jgi:hypothetical protein